MTKKPCFMTRLLAAVLAVVMLSSAIYIAVEANHDCSGDDCAICRQISICENLLKSLGLPVLPQRSLLRLHIPCAGRSCPAQRRSAH